MSEIDPPFRVLIDYGSYEGLKFHGGEHETVDDAVQAAVAASYSLPFYIIKVVNWEGRAR